MLGITLPTWGVLDMNELLPARVIVPNWGVLDMNELLHARVIVPTWDFLDMNELLHARVSVPSWDFLDMNELLHADGQHRLLHLWGTGLRAKETGLPRLKIVEKPPCFNGNN